MKAVMKKRFPLALIVALALLMVAAMGFSVAGVASAAGSPVGQISIGHMSDIHYFPIEHCYQDVNNADYQQSAFYHSMTGDTKLVLESGIILNYVVNEVIDMAKEGKAPMYMIASGDLCKNGERVALIDVANSLRFMQNEVRKVDGYEDFQVFAMVGNHDLYNSEGALYTQDGGSAKPADAVTAAQFALIFAGLGFPDANLTGDGGAINLTSYLPAEYWSSQYTGGYQASSNADNLTIKYYSEALNQVNSAPQEEKLDKYYDMGYELNQLSYFATIAGSDFGFLILDSTDREEAEEAFPIRIDKKQYDALKGGEGAEFYIDGNDGYISMDKATDAQVGNAFSNGKGVYMRSKMDHITGGRLREEVLDWAEEMTSSHSASSLDEMTYIVSFHHNLLPHFEVEDDILKDFTLYNWEYAAKRFLNMGVRYAFTGHQHSSDVVDYTDAEGRTLYDFETGSAVSYESPRRYVTLSRYDCDGKLGEQITSSLIATTSLAKLKSSNITSSENTWDAHADELMQKYLQAKDAYASSATTANKQAVDDSWQALLDEYGDYLAYMIRYTDLTNYTYNEYISKDIYAILVDRVVSHFVTDDLIASLPGMLGDMIRNLSGMIPVVLTQLGGQNALAGTVEYLIHEALYNLYEDTDNDGLGNYPYKHPDGSSDTYNGIKDYLLAIVNDLLFGVDMGDNDFMLFGDDSIASEVNESNKGKMCLRDMASFIMEAHTIGVEISLDDTYEDYDSYSEKEYKADEEFGYKSPLDKTYRKRMLAAVKDAHNQLISGKFADDLFNALLDPLFNESDSLLKTLLNHKFNLHNGVDEYLTESEYGSVKNGFANLSSLLAPGSTLLNVLGGALKVKIEIPEGYEATPINVDDFSLNDLLGLLLPIAKPLVANLLGFSLVGDSLEEILDNAIKGYITDSFKVGLGGIADDIIVAYATDKYADMSNFKDPSKEYVLQPNGDYVFGDTKLSYLSTLNTPSTVGATFNPATQDNGRVPSRLTKSFDTQDSLTAYTFKFYTAEDVYANFKFATDEQLNWHEVSTSYAAADHSADYNDCVSTATFNGVTVKVLTQTVPAYVPLIDLGLAAITHGEIVIENEDGDEIPIKYGERDIAPKNSVIYYNMTTVTVSGLAAGTTYYYDIEGVYAASNGSDIKFSLVDFAKLSGYDKGYYTFATAKGSDVDEFEFLAIADIQGMIQGMYDDSYKAVAALLKDERTSNFDFVLNAGDMVDNGKNFNQWAMALNTYQPLFANTSLIFAAGNHEDGKDAFNHFFSYTLPTQKDITDGAYYSFDYANSHFTVLNTNDSSGSGLGEDQYKWLEEDLQNTEAKWKFVLMHKSLFSGGSHSYDADIIAMREQLVPLFAKYGVSIVFAGHDHTYTTTALVKEDMSVQHGTSIDGLRYTGDGVMYITLGTLGTKFYEYAENDDIKNKFDRQESILHTLDSQTFGKVKVTGDAITFTGYYYDREKDAIEVIGKDIVLVNHPVTYIGPIIGYVVLGVLGLLAILAIALGVGIAKSPIKPKNPSSDEE